MTSKAALCKALLDGKTVNIMNGFHWFNITNVPREIGRSVERSFGVTVKRIPMRGESIYGQQTEWVNYVLLRTEENAEGIIKMMIYVNEQISGISPKTDNQVKRLKTAGINNFDKQPLEQIPLFK